MVRADQGQDQQGQKVKTSTGGDSGPQFTNPLGPGSGFSSGGRGGGAVGDPGGAANYSAQAKTTVIDLQTKFNQAIAANSWAEVAGTIDAAQQWITSAQAAQHRAVPYYANNDSDADKYYRLRETII